MINQLKSHNPSQEKLNSVPDMGAILSLTPKVEIFKNLREISAELLDFPENKLNPFLNDNLLKSHTVPLCIPLFTTPRDLELFIKKESEILIDMMLASWPFRNQDWGFRDKNIELANKLLDIKYYPIMCKAISHLVSNTLDLAVTFATPTREFVDVIVEKLASKEMILTEDELNQLEFLLASGVAIVTNKIERANYKSNLEYIKAINCSESYLTALKDNIVKTLFYFYFNSNKDFPREVDNQFLNKWFNTRTYQGMYVLPNLQSQ